MLLLTVLILVVGDFMEFDTNIISILIGYFIQAFFIGLGVGLVSWFSTWVIAQLVNFFKHLTK